MSKYPSDHQITGHFRSLNWRYPPYIRPYFSNMWMLQNVAPINIPHQMIVQAPLSSGFPMAVSKSGAPGARAAVRQCHTASTAPHDLIRMSSGLVRYIPHLFKHWCTKLAKHLCPLALSLSLSWSLFVFVACIMHLSSIFLWILMNVCDQAGYPDSRIWRLLLDPWPTASSMIYLRNTEMTTEWVLNPTYSPHMSPLISIVCSCYLSRFPSQLDN